MSVSPPEVLSRQELEQILDSFNPSTMTGKRSIAATLTMAIGGLRVTELCNVLRSEFDPERGTISVRSLKKRTKATIRRTVVLTPDAVHALREWLAVAPSSKWLFCTVKASGYGQGREPGGQWNRQQAWGMFQSAKRRAGIERRVYPHLFRHTAGDILLNDLPVPFTLHELQHQYGHESLKSTERYLHISDERMRAKMRKPLIRPM